MLQREPWSGEWHWSKGDGGAGAIIGLIYFVVAYGLGQVGRRVARMVYRDYRKWLNAAEVYNMYRGSALYDAPFRGREAAVEQALCAVTGGRWGNRFSWSLDQLPGAPGTSEKSEANRGLQRVDPFLAWTVRRRSLTSDSQKEAVNQVRYIYDVLRDYVLGSDRSDLRNDIMYHWRCMDAAQNAVLPALAIGAAVSLLAAGVGTPVVLSLLLLLILIVAPQAARLCPDARVWVVLAVLLSATIICLQVGWPASLAAIIGAFVSYLLHWSFCEHSRYLTDAIFRTFHIAWAKQEEDQVHTVRLTDHRRR